MARFLALFLIRIYQWTISPVIGSSCRFSPSCSQYSYEAFKKFGFLKGLSLMVKRLSKCHPWHPGGADPL